MNIVESLWTIIRKLLSGLLGKAWDALNPEAAKRREAAIGEAATIQERAKDVAQKTQEGSVRADKFVREAEAQRLVIEQEKALREILKAEAVESDQEEAAIEKRHEARLQKIREVSKDKVGRDLDL